MLSPIVFGIDYQTASFELRDKLAFAIDEIPGVLKRIYNSGIVKEVVLISTCNRTEVYCLTHDIEFLINSICDIKSVCPRAIRSNGYVYSGIDCVKHFFRVISGLESMVLGENEIVFQIKQAMRLAEQSETLGSSLTSLFQIGLAVEKEVRNSTKINNIAISMGRAVATIVENESLYLANKNVVFIGAGQMMQQIVPYFNDFNAGNKIVINRTLKNAEYLATKINAKADNLENLNRAVSSSSIIIACCASNYILLNSDIINNQDTKIIIDLSMPLVTDLKLKNNLKLKIFTVDDIAKIVDVGLDKRQIAASAATQIIEEKLADYTNWLHKRGLSPLIKALREKAECTRKEALYQATKQLSNGIEPLEVLQLLSIQLTNKLIHQPTVNICNTQNNFQDELVSFTSYLYDLNLEN